MASRQNGVHTNGTTSGSTITRTPSFAPVTPIVKESIGDVANRLSEVEKLIDAINLQSAASETRSPTLDDLRQEISTLSQEIADIKAEQDRKINGFRNEVKDNVKQDIKASMSQKITRQIEGAVRVQVVLEMRDWGNQGETKALVNNLEKMARENDNMLAEAEVMLENSHARHNNSTLDEHVDFTSKLSKIKLKDGTTSGNFPTTLKELFSYDEKQVLQLLEHYGLQPLATDIENLNRFLAFIGLKFTVPDQSPGFLEDTAPAPPAYQSPEISTNLESTVHSDRSQQQTTPKIPIQPVDEKAQVKGGPPEKKTQPVHNVTSPPVTIHSPEEQNDTSQAQEQRNPQGGLDNPLRSHSRTEATTSPVLSPAQSRPTQPHILANNSQYIKQQGRPTQPPMPANNSQYVRQQGRSAPQQQHQPEKPSAISSLWGVLGGGS